MNLYFFSPQMQKKIMIMTVVSHALMISIFSMFVRSELLAKLYLQTILI